ncbi:hypothetical protein D3C76_1478790 [compost metagenome]
MAAWASAARSFFARRTVLSLTPNWADKALVVRSGCLIDAIAMFILTARSMVLIAAVVMT